MKTDPCFFRALLVASALFAAAPGGSLARNTSPATASPMEIALPATKRALEAATPGGLRLTDVSTKGSKVEFSGVAETVEQIKVYLRALNRDTGFRNAALLRTGKSRTNSLLTFDMEAEVVCTPSAGAGQESLCKRAGSN